MNQATGTFEVKLTPQADGDDCGLGRMRIDKQFVVIWKPPARDRCWRHDRA